MANVVKYVPAGSSYDPYTDSDVGTIVSYNSSTGRVEFKDIDFNALGALLGLTKPFTFKDCVLSPNVNPNAIFKPSTTPPYTLGDFAGYQHLSQEDLDSFKFTIDTSKGLSPSFRLAVVDGYNYNYKVNWGDGDIETVNSFRQGTIPHSYSKHGVYTISVSGVFGRWSFQHGWTAYSRQIISIEQWGNLGFTNMDTAFSNCYNLISINDLNGSWCKNVTSMSSMFYSCGLLNSDISSWNVSKVTNMNSMFRNATSFNQDLSQWCVSLISSKPYDFDTGANAWSLSRPVWGTCPRGENL